MSSAGLDARAHSVAALSPRANRPSPHLAIVSRLAAPIWLLGPSSMLATRIIRLSELLPVIRIENKAIASILYEFICTSTAIRYKNRQTGGHCLVHHESPWFSSAGMNEGTCQAVVNWQFGILNEPRKVHAAMQVKSVEPGAQSRAKRPIAKQDQVPRLLILAPCQDLVSSICLKQFKQILFFDEPRGCQEILLRQVRSST